MLNPSVSLPGSARGWLPSVADAGWGASDTHRGHFHHGSDAFLPQTLSSPTCRQDRVTSGVPRPLTSDRIECVAPRGLVAQGLRLMGAGGARAASGTRVPRPCPRPRRTPTRARLSRGALTPRTGASATRCAGASARRPSTRSVSHGVLLRDFRPLLAPHSPARAL